MSVLQLLQERQASLEEQLVLWEQVQSCQDEVDVWLGAVVQKLEDSTNRFGDVVVIENQIQTYNVSSGNELW